MIAVYCANCDNYTALTLDRIQMSQESTAIVADVICPTCLFTMTTLKADEDGAYALAKLAQLAGSPPGGTLDGSDRSTGAARR